MPAYVVFIHEQTHDVAEMAAYAEAVAPILRDQPVKFLAANGALKVLEGPEPEGVAIAEFPNLAAAVAWYESPAYQAAAQHRFKGARYRGFVVEGVTL